MTEIVMATGNSHKVFELNELLKPYMNGEYKLISMREAGFTGEINETGSTFEENAEIKASSVSKALNCIAIADDSGLCVDALGGSPGIYSARYGGENTDYNTKMDKLNEELASVPEEKRTAAFVSVICLVYPDGKKIFCRGECKGRIIPEKRGNGTFGYDPVFYYEPMGKTFAEMTSEEKNSVSHRGKAVQNFIQKFFLDK